MTNNTAKTGAAYIRVSTDKQEELSPDAQKRLILQYAKTHNILISPENIYFEKGISGRSVSKRPAFQTMIAKAKSKEHPFDVILVWKFSRFARNQEESIVYKSMLQRDHVEVVSISEPVIEGPFGSLIERIIEWMDEYYSIRLSGEVLRGMTEKALRGGYQAVPPYGYTYTGKFPPEVNPSQAAVVQHIYGDFLSGKTYTAIARELNTLGICTAKGNPFEPRTIKYILENPFYCGKIRWNYTKHGGERKSPENWIITEGSHEALVSESEWLSAQARIEKGSFPGRPRDVKSCRHWLSGILKCSSCGASLGFNSRGGYFQCWKYCKGKCSISHSVSVKIIESNVIAGLKASVLSHDMKYNLPQKQNQNDFKDELHLLNKQYKKLLEKEQRIQDAYENGIDTLEEYSVKKTRIHGEKKSLEEKIHSLPSPPVSPGSYMETKKTYDSLYAAEILARPDIDYEKKGTALRSVVQKIVYDKEKEQLDFFFFLE